MLNYGSSKICIIGSSNWPWIPEHITAKRPWMIIRKFKESCSVTGYIWFTYICWQISMKMKKIWNIALLYNPAQYITWSVINSVDKSVFRILDLALVFKSMDTITWYVSDKLLLAILWSNQFKIPAIIPFRNKDKMENTLIWFKPINLHLFHRRIT